MKRVALTRLVFSVIVLAACLSPAVCEAAFTLRLTSGLDSVTLVDDGAGDFNNKAGAITFIGELGTYTLNVTTGLRNPTYPLISEPFPMLDLNSVNVSSSGAGVLTIELWDDFDAMGGGVKLINDAGGTFPAGSVEFVSIIDPIVGSTITSTPLVLQGPSDSDSNSVWIDGGLSAFTLKQVVTITTTGTTTVSFDFSSRVVPEPATVLLWGGLFLGGAVTAVGRRRSLGK